MGLREWGLRSDPGVLLWPGLGFSSAYFVGSAELFCGRAVAVDPPGWGPSPKPAAYSYDLLVEAAVDTIRVCDCRAMVGHSLGGDIALGVAAEPPSSLRAVVLIDGGYLEPADAVELGMPDGSDRNEMVAYMREHQARFADWEAAGTAFANLLDTEELTPACEAAFRETLIEVDGGFRQAASPELFADALMPFMTDLHPPRRPFARERRRAGETVRMRWTSPRRWSVSRSCWPDTTPRTSTRRPSA